MNEKLKWILETWFYGSDNDLVYKAIFNDKISLEEFINGFDALRNARWENKEIIPAEFENL